MSLPLRLRDAYQYTLPAGGLVAEYAGSPAQGSLRTKQTIEKFKSVPVQPGTTSPLLVYFGTLLTRGKLNAFESVELSRLVLSQNKKHLLDNWFKVRRRRPFVLPHSPVAADVHLHDMLLSRCFVPVRIHE